MKRAKKLVIIAVITVVALGGILGGVAVANADEETTTPAPADVSTLAERVADKYEQLTGVAIEADKLVEAFNEVRQDIHSEAVDRMIDRLVEDGRMDEAQAQEFKDWLEARPDVPFGPRMDGGNFFGRFGDKFGGRFGGMPRGWCWGDNAPDATD